MDERLKEIRRVLMGMHTHITENAIAAADLLKMRTMNDVRGAGSVFMRGVTEYRKQFRLNGDLQDAENACVKAALQMGQQVILRSAPNTLAVLHWPTFRNPAILTLENEERDLLLCCVTAKNVLASRNAEKVFQTWMLGMPDILREVSVSREPQCIRSEIEPVKKKKKKEKKKKKKEE